MGVPKFFRWLSERYPKINERAGFLPEETTALRHFDELPPPPLLPPDPLSLCGLPPPIDRLYIDMNGIIHGCSHNNNSSPNPDENITHDEIFRNVAYYLDRIVADIARPTQLVYLSIDGVAPRAKLNQQRSRRYRSGNEGEIEESVYEAHLRAYQKQNGTMDDSDGVPGFDEYTNAPLSHISGNNESLTEVEPGRFAGKFESHAIEPQEGEKFHHNEITPGTPFFQACTDFLHSYIKTKMETDEKWKHLTIIFSGSDVPGEGEHKIMDFIRRERVRPDYNVNTKHCIMGQDGDWIMLGLATHEPNLVLLREQVVFEAKRQAILETNGISSYIHNPNFEWLHLSILRDYLAYEFETREVVPSSEYDLEATIDDFVFLTFLVGNDFLPHLPALDIADEAFELLFHIYRKQRKDWQNETNRIRHPYLTHAGNIVSGKRLEQFVQQLGQHESPYYDNKKREQPKINERTRKSDSKHGRESSVPADEVLELKEEADRQKYREMLTSLKVNDDMTKTFSPVLTNIDIATSFQPSTKEEDDEVEEGMIAKMSNLLHFSIEGANEEKSSSGLVSVDDQDLKGRYYYDKFGFTPVDAEKHIALRRAYVEGLVWTLKYYYQGVVSWDWFYPYHYGPMLSDLVGIDEYLDEVSFDDMGEPLKPFEQLMGCLPPSSAHLLPEPYRWLMTESSSPLNEFYPRTFTVDMNGKRWPWEAVVLLPFMDSKRLTNAARNLVDEDLLTEEERKRNLNGHAWVVSCEDGSAESKFVPLKLTNWDFQPEETAVLKPKLLTGVQHPSPGFPTLRSAPIRSLWRRNVGINVFGIRSRYRTALLVLGEVLPTIPPLEMLGKKLIGTTVYVNYPYLMEGFVTAISDSESTMRGVGKNSIRQWDANESLFFQQKSSSVKKNHAFGEKVTGSGGWMIPDHDTILTVRPLKGVTTLPDGSKARVFAKFEIDVPLTAAIWAPSYEDWRLSSIPALMEKDPFSVVVDKEKSKGSVSASSDTLLLPEYDESDSISNLASTGPVLPQLPESDPYSPQLILPAFEEQDPPVMHPLHDKDMAAMEKVTESTKEPRFKGSTLLPPKKPTSGLKGSSTKESSSSLLPPTDDFVAIASRGIATSSCSFRRPNQPSGRRSFSTGRSASIRVRSGSTRTRLFALGTAVATAIFFGGSYAQALHEPVLVSCGGSISLASKWQTIRGGGDHAPLFEENDGNKSLIDDATPPLLEFAHGTTTLSFLFEGGVVAAVDSRASLGNFVGSKTTQKVLPISSHMLGTMAGGAADCMFWIRKIKAEAHFHELSEGHRMTVARASKLLANALYQNRALNLSVGTMIMGFDEKNGPQIYYVDNTGARINGELFAVGSGSTFAYAILDTERRKDMTEEEAIALGIKAIRHATFRDAFSGGFINVYVINKDGWRKVFSEDLANIMTEDMSASNRMQ